MNIVHYIYTTGSRVCIPLFVGGTLGITLYAVGFVHGYSLQVKQPLALHITNTTVIPSIHTVTIQGIRNQQVYGTVTPNTRLFIGDALVQAQSGAFSVPAGPLLVHQVNITIPTGMQYVASTKGKKFYAVTSKSAMNITPGNRVYFKTSADAIAAGYTD
jgi:hypothetical protein